MERFAYTVSHDLKSPLFTIHGFLGIVETDLVAGREHRVRENLERIRGAATQMNRMLDELLELSLLGRAVDRVQGVPLGELAREALDLVAGQIAERGVEVVLSPDLPVVRGDRRRLLQVLQNLIDNAVKFMGSQIAPRIEIGTAGERIQSTDRDGKEAVCFVRDNGVGIEPGDCDKVFGLFDQLDPKAQGTGIGLALVERIIRLHGGRVWVESEGAGRGCTFYFSIQSRSAE